MKQFVSILIKTGIVLLIVAALLVSALRFALPYLDKLHQPLMAQVQYFSGVPIEIGKIEGEWKTFGPSLKLTNLSLNNAEIRWHADNVVVELDVWRSLLHFRWQFRDLTFYNMYLDFAASAFQNDLLNDQSKERTPVVDKIANLFLRQINYFDLRDSHVAFYSPSGQRVALDIPQLTWLNSRKRHQAEGQVSLSSFNNQYGALQVRLDLSDGHKNLLDNGTIYVQADDVDMSLWFSRWLRNTTGLKDAAFSLAAWINIKDGEINGGDLLLKQGQLKWQTGQELHSLLVDEQRIRVNKLGNSWHLEAPVINMSIDGHSWPKGQVSILWLAENSVQPGPPNTEQLRIRARDLQLELLKPLLPIFTFLDPEKLMPFLTLNPEGILDELALDIPLNQPETMRFIAKWREISWNVWDKLPGVNHFNGEAKGSLAYGVVNVALANSVLPYDGMFRAPLEVSKVQGALSWQSNSEGWRMWSEDLDIQAKSLWINGGFEYSSSLQNGAWLNILAGIRLYDAKEAWRYFPEPLMGSNLVDYLTDALQGGQADNATLIFSGDPNEFPYKTNTGLFEVFVPLRQATFSFHSDWQPLTDLSIDLDFINDGLWMYAKTSKLDKVDGSEITATIPVYSGQKLFIDAKINGKGEDIHSYFRHSPLKDSVSVALDQAQITGNVSGRLHLSIPIDGKDIVQASGEITLRDNDILITSIGSTLEKVNGNFTFNGGELNGERLTASWFNQPVAINFSNNLTTQGSTVNVGLQGVWQLSQLPWLPDGLSSSVSGSAKWQSDIVVNLRKNEEMTYRVDLQGEVKQVSKDLASLFNLTENGVLPIGLQANGNQQGFLLSGSLTEHHHLISEWLLDKKEIKLARGAVSTDAKPTLPKEERLMLNLPAIDGESWAALFATASGGGKGDKSLQLPKQIIVSSPVLTWLGQRWNDLNLKLDSRPTGKVVDVTAKELKGKLSALTNSPWRADIAYLYYNPQWPEPSPAAPATRLVAPPTVTKQDFRRWPALILRCGDCWLMGQSLNRLEMDLLPSNTGLKLTHGLLDTGNTLLSLEGDWLQQNAQSKINLKGTLKGDKIDHSLRHFGVVTPLHQSPFETNFTLSWQGTPWSPRVDTLNGQLTVKLGKGEIAKYGGGTAGQILRLVSVSALLRKLQFDFSDTFGESFYFDKIDGNSKIVNGIMVSDNILIKGLAADIAISGQVDLIQRQLNLDAVVAPELSATVGVATAFVINPVIGVAVFAASQVLSPLWNKISFIRYKISGDIDNPDVSEIQRQPNEEKTSEKR